MAESAPANPASLPASVSAGGRAGCRVVFVTGPRGAGKTRWMQGCIDELRRTRSETRVAVLLCEEGRARMETFCAEREGVALRKLFPPCLCCPPAADLPGTLESLVAASSAAWAFVELPTIAAAGLLTEFDRALAWPRSLVVLLTPKWAEAVRTGVMSLFQCSLTTCADAVAGNPAEAQAATRKVLGIDTAPETELRQGSPDSPKP